MLFLWITTKCLRNERPNLQVKWLYKALLDLDDVEAYISQTNSPAAEESSIENTQNSLTVAGSARTRQGWSCSRHKRTYHS